MEIGESGTERMLQASCAVFVGSAVRLGRVVEEVVGEDFLEDVEVPTALHFFGVPADDRFRGFARCTVTHESLSTSPSSLLVVNDKIAQVLP